MSCVTVAGQYISNASRGHIQLILGPMFSGKSTELIRRMRRFTVANHSCLMIKYAKDNRYSDDGVATHDHQISSAMLATTLKLTKKEAFKHGVIGIDEGQFFPDIVEFCEEMANAGKTVIVAALDGTFQRKPFGTILDLVPLAESVVKLKAVCMICFKDAAFTKRLGSEKEIEVIGGADKYMAVCRTCHTMPDRKALVRSEHTPTRGGGDITLGRQLFPDDH